jgi:GR25 family glycosyltransferase involved in LPS biosynthesis
MDTIDKIYIINLYKDVDRLNNAYKQLVKYNITNYERFAGINAAILSDNDINNNTTIIGKIFASRGMIGCGLSHINIWKKIVENNINRTLILEDDFILKDNFLNKFNKYIKKAPEKFDILFLNSNFIHNKNIKLIDINDIFYKQLFIAQTVGYIITLDGAKKILKYINKVSYHIDIDICIRHLFNNDLNIISIKDELIYQTFDTSNNINDREFPLILDKLLYDNSIIYYYKAVLMSICDFTINLNIIVIFLMGYYIFPYSLLLMNIEYIIKKININKYIQNLLILILGYIFKLKF